MAAQEISIGGNDYDVYVIVAQADEYLAADVKRFTAWAALTTDEKGQAIITSTRRLDRIKWEGLQTDTTTPQPLEWPRTGAADCDEVAVDVNTVPDEIDEACILLAADISVKPSLGDDTSTDSNLKRAVAGSVEVEFFKTQGGTILPSYIMELVSCFFGGSGGVGFVIATGTDVDSTTDVDNFDRTDGFA